MPEARDYRLEDLAKELRQKHSPVGTSEVRALQALNDHSEPILNGIRSSIGHDLHLARGEVLQQVLDGMAATQVVLSPGLPAAGSPVLPKMSSPFSQRNILHSVFARKSSPVRT